MLIVNTSVDGAFEQLHHSPFLTKRITFADVQPSILLAITDIVFRIDYIPYFPSLRGILSLDIKTPVPATLSSNLTPGRSRTRIQFRGGTPSRSTHTVSRRSATHRVKFVCECCTAVSHVAIPVRGGGTVVVE